MFYHKLLPSILNCLLLSHFKVTIIFRGGGTCKTARALLHRETLPPAPWPLPPGPSPTKKKKLLYNSVLSKKKVTNLLISKIAV